MFKTFSHHSNISGKPLLIFSNKQDVENRMSSEELLKLLEIEVNAQLKCYECTCMRPSSVSEDETFSDARVDQGIEWLLACAKADFENLDSRVKSDLLIKEEHEKKKRLERERRVLKNKMASAFIKSMDPSLVPEGVEENTEDVFTKEEGCIFLASEIGVENLSEEAVEVAELAGFQRLAIQMIGALNSPISKKKVPMSWFEIRSMLIEIRDELGLQ